MNVLECVALSPHVFPQLPVCVHVLNLETCVCMHIPSCRQLELRPLGASAAAGSSRDVMERKSFALYNNRGAAPPRKGRRPVSGTKEWS